MQTLEKTDIARRLLTLPEDLTRAERAALEASQDLNRAKEALEDAEAHLLLGDQITGKNAEQRTAQLREATAPARERLLLRQEKAAYAAAQLRTIQAEFSALRAVARLLAGEPD